MFLALALAQAAFIPLTRAHAHNDYFHTHPLVDAMTEGYCSIEADIFLEGGEMRVGHDRNMLKPGKTLQALYLDPMYKAFLENSKNGVKSIYPVKAPSILLVEFKSDPEALYPILKEELKKYKGMISTYKNGKVKTRAITIIITGQRPRKQAEAETERNMFLDGEIGDLTNDTQKELVPLVSDSYETLFGTSKAPLSAEKHKLLVDYVSQAHKKGMKIRFWEAPDNEAAWEELYSADVDLINTDRLKDLRAFLLKKKQP